MATTKITSLSLTDGTYTWAESAVTGEFYIVGGLDSEPTSISTLAAGTVGTLGNEEWDWADNDTLTYNTVYVHLTGSVDPTTLTYSDLVAQVSETLLYDVVGAKPKVTETVTPVTLAAATVTLALTVAANTRTVQIWDEDTGAAIWYAYATSTPALANMRAVPSGSALAYSEIERGEGNLYLYSVAGGDVKVVEGA